ncbi:MAG TPA: 50S ribosomal protein L29 [Verrucomicrobiae bacterium]|jgi:large subunit ribosomal protein L29|nr:50S ribosomal protein L29 [Verrucomicrobiae bacterium]
MLKASELRNLSVEELIEKADKLKKDLMQFRFQAKTAKLEQQNLLRETRRDIARILTVVSELKNEKEVKA